ncbi:Diacylglycerol kinase family enzyme [Pseudosulfitobacter pseudonitzschiae]|uniref:diacylglycerol/lipid kinase family protein n=1 Tax=Pseudosulfitobacter pseudonitzschiae TaxID=1402135 RepID=UPI000689DD45|nr:diacylglycerol kinase family protein [Pseudosulfitobacter pseudonitzschiae]QKS09531.1 NAD(+)/NADH kinase [Pseudosulfitobacter pseudonitzschiae]SHF04738.1 Diacylglycerol kinase family enzyme [Pseudosulfitobacter pseudonitzschiae]
MQANTAPDLQTDATPLKAHVLVNLKSGRGSGQPDMQDLERAFREHGIDAHVIRLSPGDDIPARAAQLARDGAELVVAAGGDGTICGVASGLVGTQTVMGVIPLGTFNYFGRSLNIPETAPEAIEVIARNRPKELPVGLINDRVFLNNASLGIYPQILRTRETVYARWGRSRVAAYWSVLKTMVRLPRRLKLQVTIDGETREIKTSLLFAVSNAFQLEQMGLEGTECIEAGQLAVLIAPNRGRMGLLKNGIALMLGLAQRDQDFDLLCAQSLHITCKRKSLLIARDGERTRIRGPFDLELRQGALKVLTPGGEDGVVR